MSHHCGAETLTVHVEGEPGEDYAALLTTAMLKAGDRLGPATTIMRSEGDCGGVGGLGVDEEWFLSCGHADLAPVGTKLEGHFTFQRYSR